MLKEVITKSHLRKSLLQYRRLLPVNEYGYRNLLLLKKLEDILDTKKFKTIHIFLPIEKNNEPDLRPLLSNWWNDSKKVVVSKTDLKNKKIRHLFLEAETKLVKSPIGIPEPTDASEASIAAVDIILVPLLFVDKNGNRIGYGGGYYDGILKESGGISIGISLTDPVDTIPQTESWDIPLDYLITPFNSYAFRA